MSPLVSLCALAWSLPAAAADYVAFELATVDVPYSHARAVNASGQVAGMVLLDQEFTAATWTDMGTPDVAPLPPAFGSQAEGINALGHSAGWSLGESDSRFHGFVWASGTLTDLGPDLRAQDINDGGVVTGTSAQLHPFRWSADTGLQILEDHGRGDAFDINNVDQIVGYVVGTDGWAHATSWTADDAPVELGELGSDVGSVASSVNDAGEAAGYSFGSGLRAVAWRDGGVIDLHPGGADAVAKAINNRGDVVGWVAEGSSNAVYLWPGGGGPELRIGLPADTWWCDPEDINDAGVIVGECWSNVTGFPSAYVWTPEVPDLDHDGLDDTFDACPSVHGGTDVNANGCPDLQDLLGFDDPQFWSPGGRIVADGRTALEVTPTGWTPIVSDPFAATGVSVGSTLLLDVFVPANPPNPWWLGDLQAHATCPTANVHNAWLGYQSFAGKPLGAWSTLTLQVPPQVQAALSSGALCTLSLNLNAPAGGPAFRFDAMRFQ